jgi:hypothetical protein
MNSRQKLGNPAFIVAVILLILNDWYLKQTFSNGFTGKLSDFAGLFALPFLLSALLPRHAVKLYFLTGILFIVWKLPAIQPLMDSLSNIGIPLHRTVDYTDYVALIILPFSWHLFNKSASYQLKPLLLNALVIVATFGFAATSRPPGKDKTFNNINKTYIFDCSKRELISRFNMVETKDVDEINKYSGTVDFDSKTGTFHFKDRKDTLATLIDFEKVKNLDTIYLKTAYAQIGFFGNETSSGIKLFSYNIYVPTGKDEKYREKANKIFERWIVKPIRNYRHALHQ